jgi:hypothetical protein
MVEYRMRITYGLFKTLCCGRVWLTVIVAVLVTACGGIEKSADFDRHRYSQLTTRPATARKSSTLIVLFPAEFPRDDPAAEAARMRWLGVWLAQRSICPQGFDVYKAQEL